MTQRRFPFVDRIVNWFISRLGVFPLPGWCNICRMPTFFFIRNENLREDVFCHWCGSFNRQRQMMYVFRRMCTANRTNDTIIWNTESRGSFHERLKKKFQGSYLSSEYFGDDIVSSTFVNGVRHEDMCRTSFHSNFLNFIFSSDDLEHIPEPQVALNEISRILKENGKFIFTVPFHVHSSVNEVRAKRNPDGGLIHFKDPEFHGDPLRPSEGILVYTIFGWELIRMCAKAGLLCEVYKTYAPMCGILGSNGIVFVCHKKGKR
jgi:SAM-dependent methyltransferase